MQQAMETGILGVGNLLLADEGFGVHCIRRLEQGFVFPANVELLDGGTAGIMLAPFMEDKEQLFVIDVVNLQDPPGTIHVFNDRDVTAGNIQTRMSPHQVGLLEILDLCRLRGKAPKVEMITVVPGDLSTRIGLSEPLETAMEAVIDLLFTRLHGLDIYPVPTAMAADA